MSRRRLRVIVSALVVAGICSSAVATCTASAMTSETAQMACCKGGHHTCGKDGAPADCCKKRSSPQPQWNAVAKADSLKAPVRVFLALVTPAHPLSDAALLVQPARAAAPSPPLRPQGPPIYIVFSTFLI